ncbi:unnamed protein product [Closterium sp. Yama58-4]|nr:unnamed protein product [Closterium sp. Yama58-4]
MGAKEAAAAAAVDLSTSAAETKPSHVAMDLSAHGKQQETVRMITGEGDGIAADGKGAKGGKSGKGGGKGGGKDSKDSKGGKGMVDPKQAAQGKDDKGGKDAKGARATPKQQQKPGDGAKGKGHPVGKQQGKTPGGKAAHGKSPGGKAPGGKGAGGKAGGVVPGSGKQAGTVQAGAGKNVAAHAGGKGAVVVPKGKVHPAPRQDKAGGGMGKGGVAAGKQGGKGKGAVPCTRYCIVSRFEPHTTPGRLLRFLLSPAVRSPSFATTIFLTLRKLITMAKGKGGAILVKLLSAAGTGFFYVTKKNPRNLPHKLEFRKYDPRVQKHVLFTETKLR